jgi:hypothetical protein
VCRQTRCVPSLSGQTLECLLRCPKPVRRYSPDIPELAAANNTIYLRRGGAGSSRKWEGEFIGLKRLDGGVGVALAPAITQVATGVPADPGVRYGDRRNRRLQRHVGGIRRVEAQAQRSAGQHGKFGAIHKYPWAVSICHVQPANLTMQQDGTTCEVRQSKVPSCVVLATARGALAERSQQLPVRCGATAIVWQRGHRPVIYAEAAKLCYVAQGRCGVIRRGFVAYDADDIR